MLKQWSLLLTAAAVLASCAPYPPEPPRHLGPLPLPDTITPEYKTPEEIARDQEAAARRAAERKREQEAREREAISKPATPPKPDKPKYPKATAIPGKAGHVFNPYTNDPVDVRGIPSGSLVTDPNDAESRKFRVP